MEPLQRHAAWFAGTGVVVVLAVAIALLGVRSAPAPLVVGGFRPALASSPIPSPAAALVPHGATAPAIPLAVAPTPGPAVTAGADTPEPDAVAFTPVPAYRAAVIVDVAPAEEAAAREAITALDGVVHVAGVTVTAASMGGVPADIAQVDPDEFRPFTPEATANSQPLWERIVAGDVAVTHEFGTTHEVVLGTRLETGSAGPLRVGAFATNGTPPVADAIVVAGTPIGDGVRRLLVALEAEASPTATVQVLEEAGLAAEAIPDPRAPRDDIVIPAGGITPENVWDHLAVCESSGNWQINTGNGYYGGVQFLPESWAMVGGTGLPHEHSREEQIHRAVLLWQIQGWEAWPQCARKLGLIVDAPGPSDPE